MTDNHDKLIEYGFELTDGKYKYTTEIFDNQFIMTVIIDESGAIATTLFEKDIAEIYTLHLVSGASGKFVSKVREEYDKVLNDITKKCFILHTYSEITAKIIDYAHEKYGDEPEYLWKKYPDTFVLRRKATKKWYAIFMTVAGNKLGLEGDKLVPIVDIHCDSKELHEKVDNVRFFPGYHMNKMHWLSALLDGSVDIEEICDFIDKSYNMAK